MNQERVSLLRQSWQAGKELTEGLHGWDAGLQEGQPEGALLQLHIKGLVEGEYHQMHAGRVADEVIVDREVRLVT